jgi:hypothetical protein
VRGDSSIKAVAVGDAAGRAAAKLARAGGAGCSRLSQWNTAAIAPIATMTAAPVLRAPLALEDTSAGAAANGGG